MYNSNTSTEFTNTSIENIILPNRSRMWAFSCLRPYYVKGREHAKYFCSWFEQYFSQTA